MERVARGLVIATAASLLFAIVAATSVLRTSSGTYMAIVVFTPILLAPGVLVWWRPRPPSLSIWAIWSFIASLFYLLGGSPYGYERELHGWQFVKWPMWIAVVLSVVGATVVSFAMSARARPQLPATSRTRRIQQAARLSVALGAVTVLVTILAMDAPLAAHFWNTAIIAFILAPASYVYRVAQRGSTIMWAAWTSPFAAIMAFFSMLSTDEPHALEAPLRMWLLSYGTLMTMICIVTPLVAFVSSDEVSDLPTARVQ